MLEGKTPFDLCFLGKIKNLLPSDKIGKGAKGTLKVLYNKAAKEYKKLRGIAEERFTEK